MSEWSEWVHNCVQVQMCLLARSFMVASPLHGTHLLRVRKQRRSVVLPLLCKLSGCRELAAGKLNRDFKAVGVQVVEVLHHRHEGAGKQSHAVRGEHVWSAHQQKPLQIQRPQPQPRVCTRNCPAPPTCMPPVREYHFAPLVMPWSNTCSSPAPHGLFWTEAADSKEDERAREVERSRGRERGRERERDWFVCSFVGWIGEGWGQGGGRARCQRGGTKK